MTRIAILSLLPMTLLAGCSIGPDYTAPPAHDIQVTDIMTTEADRIDVSLDVEMAWWDRFDDPVLSALMETAAGANTDVRLAAYRVEEARANRAIAQARRRPFLSGSSSASRAQASETAGGFGVTPGSSSIQNLFDLNVNLTWELDIFGRLLRLENAAEAQLEATEGDRRAVMVTVFAEIGIAYAELRGLQAQDAAAGRNIELASRIVDLTQQVVDQGLAADFDLVRARADVTELAARRHRLLAGQRAAAARIAFLTGQQPADVMESLLAAGPQMIPSARIPVGLPSDLLRRRPDIRAAERRAAAASELVGVEMTDLLPSFSLTGVAGLSAANVEDLFDAASQTWSLSGGARWSLFDSGAQRADIAIARSRLGAAGTEYEAIILNALAELETALAAYVYTAKELDGLVAARSNRERAYALALQRYNANTDTLFPALDAGLRLTALNADIAARQQDLLVAEISVYRALGGGWLAFENQGEGLE
ncbi:efflux transporter outer membrane subunit [Aquisalinus flavus]|uniref:Multidrug efflux outer membrane protein OprN n=1 Tax=Aquisalinus flavus TaxID=1526572 RepID=A0A8J2V2L7_9PROT|nr:efflux transporter outer membrane subunit [Aquisalinus flavus]MBD0425986.1 efflux transporter outer membrane subunit [Aquisalinus flavus]UNE48423.1 efflux transporter outer membrane subunit [Aquisalinus flavus]GGD11625.1 multidrug efflux outer membrane protein OprN [Aquisalinus flavus]